VPFTDPIADGPTIQTSNTVRKPIDPFRFLCLALTQPKVALENGVTIQSTLQMVRDARKQGLKAPILLMGYYNPLLSYGEDRLLTDCKAAGVNGFIVVDLPPEEAVSFRKLCTKGGYEPHPALLDPQLGTPVVC
jgi:tryptophan synthase